MTQRQGDAQSPTLQGSPSPTAVMMIDSHRNHLAILEAFTLLLDLKSSQTHSLSPELSQCLTRCLIRLQFFLIHTSSPLLSQTDRLDLARVKLHSLGGALELAPHRHEILSKIRLATR